MPLDSPCHRVYPIVSMTQSRPLWGAFTALVTPFTSDGCNVDGDALEALVSYQIEQCIDGLVPCGTTGESPTLSDDERRDIITRTVKIAAGRVPVVAGTGSNDTKKSLRTSQEALELGADAVMIVMPYYNKPSQEGMFRHVTTIATQIGGAPVVVYNIPGRSVVDLSTDTLARIVDAAPNVVAVKDATGNVQRCQEVVRRFGGSVAVLSGDDALTLPMMACGAKGVISVTSNVYPRRVASMCLAMRVGDLDSARSLHYGLLPVHEAMFVEPSPVPVKTALAMQQRIQFAVRLPMVPPTEATRNLIEKTLNAYDALDLS